jgi:hypothetical protein
MVAFAVMGTAKADDAAPPADDALQVHAFVSQGFLKSTDNNFLADSKNGSFEFWEAGINFTKPITDRLRTGIQFFSRDLGPLGDYKAKIDWAYLDYHLHDWLGIRAGRIKLPFGLYNDTSDIDAVHSVALLPQSVYPAQNRDFLLAQTGVEVYGYRDFKKLGSLDYRGYAGTIYLDTPAATPGSPIALVRLTIPYVVGGRLMWEPRIEGLRIGFSIQKLRLETSLLDLRVATMPKTATANIPATLGVVSLEYTKDDVLIAAEYARWYTSVESSDPTLFPAQSLRSDRAYLLFALHARPWIQPGAYYSIHYPDFHKQQAGPSAKQHDMAATLRFDINPNWILKLEAHYMRGTAGLSTSLNPGVTLDQLHDHWMLFVAKTTVYF